MYLIERYRYKLNQFDVALSELFPFRFYFKIYKESDRTLYYHAQRIDERLESFKILDSLTMSEYLSRTASRFPQKQRQRSVLFLKQWRDICFEMAY